MTGPCAKQVVTATFVSPGGLHYVGRNDCKRPQASCPREPGEGYDKCVSVCGQEFHAEIAAVFSAAADGSPTKGGHVYVEGHTCICENCFGSLAAFGISCSIGPPPPE